MIGAAVAWTLWWASVGPNHYLLSNLFDRSDELQHRLVPLEVFEHAAEPLWIVPHDRPDWAAVFFVPAESWHRGTEPAFALGTERLLPSLRVPRLFVARRYLDEGEIQRGLRAVEPLAVDEAEALWRALASVRLHRFGESREARARLDQRANELMSEVPEEQRLAAYRSAQEDFAAHLLSIRHEVGRHQRRRGAGELCGILDHPATLFGFWRRAVEEGSYPGYFSRRASADSPPRSARRGNWAMTRAALREEDKAWVMAEALGTEWSGDPAQDFEFLCP